MRARSRVLVISAVLLALVLQVSSGNRVRALQGCVVKPLLRRMGAWSRVISCSQFSPGHHAHPPAASHCEVNVFGFYIF